METLVGDDSAVLINVVCVVTLVDIDVSGWTGPTMIQANCVMKTTRGVVTDRILKRDNFVRAVACFGDGWALM